MVRIRFASILVFLACLACSAPLPPLPPPEPPPPLWFNDLVADAGDGQKVAQGASAMRLDPAEAALLLGLVHASLRGEQASASLPPRLADDTAPRAIFVSVSDGRGPADVALGVGQGMGQALERAMADLGARARDRDAIRWLALDLVTRVGEREILRHGDPVDFRFGLEGVAFDRSLGLAFPPREIVGRRLVSRAGSLRRERMAERAERRELAYARAVLLRPQDVGVRPFETQGFFFDGATGDTRELFRGHILERAVTDERLQEAVTTGADYLARAVDAKGRFAYSYLAKQGEVEDEYNMVRHAGTIFAMVQAWDGYRDAGLEQAIERAIHYMLEHVEPYGPAGDGMSALAYDGKIKLGGVALAALALATHVQVSGSDEHLDTARRLCRYLVAQQRPDGSFLHQREHPGGEPLSFISEYYPGEAILALATLHQLDPDPVWLDAAQKGARYLIEVRDRGLETPQLTHDHWLLYGLEKVYRASRDERFVEHAMRIAEAIVMAQIRPRPGVAPDEVGAYKRPARSTPIATRNEGLMAAYALARDTGRLDMARRILDAVELGNEVLISMQIDGARALYLQDPERALGGVTRTYDHFGVRIDYVQHSISAWLALMAARGESREREPVDQQSE